MLNSLTKDSAIVLMKLTEDVNQALNVLDEELRKIENENYKREALTSIADTIFNLYIKVQRPIVKLYPELDPDK